MKKNTHVKAKKMMSLDEVDEKITLDIAEFKKELKHECVQKEIFEGGK